ncbi:aminopeptidase N [Alcaligenes endophyticus]|uniref:Aminopeptidase N n=1 Tax=Alcaligenes endophyticus TaxID=1929088 RepID=A0ABT8EHY5_9BURK|nr:aminopeptidase N [Alcaligenes endophyticus]MCX5592710.1 aminopeptidase N [Alcaligenes endophyticus]MDN4120898.1 aminopeptidase N [Alcaligenes endophyticus]
MRTDSPVTISRYDYQPYPYDIQAVELQFDLDSESSQVLIRFEAHSKGPTPTPLILDGEELKLLSVSLNGVLLPTTDFKAEENSLTLYPKQTKNIVEIVSVCKPALNTTLMGLYVSGAHLFTQCEAQGFRRIAYFPDRPDVMATYKVVLRAKKAHYPILLSNGNLLASEDLEAGYHQAIWEDPFPKPSYLFALVAGDFDVRSKEIQKASGAKALLQVYSDKGDYANTEWAMQCLENSVRWDEQRFGLELDLDRFMIVAAHDFNMGAMENKGLNIFNAAYVLAHPSTTTDSSYQAIEAVIGHEYFHNWTGNRVTCKDWFQLSLKEGLTVFRDQEFSADMQAQGLDGVEALSARAVKRIDDVSILRSAQFPEDAGPMAHPIRPESYEEISNFYTATIYEKGAEVIRMLHTLLGEQDFQAGMREYFARHDGQAVSCDDFLDALDTIYRQRGPEYTLETFRRWYEQAGTPTVAVQLDYDETQRSATVTLTQRNPAVGIETRHAHEKPPLHIPFRLGMLNAQGQTQAFSLDGQTHTDVILNLQQSSQSWHLSDLRERPVLSLLRQFSAPIKVEYYRSDAELSLLAQHDPEPFARWEAMQLLLTRHLLAAEHSARQNRPVLLQTFLALIQDKTLSPAYLARILSLPSERELLEQTRPMNPQRVVQAKRTLQQDLGLGLAPYWQELYQYHQQSGAYQSDALSAGKRALKNLALNYLAAAGVSTALQLALRQFNDANNMTDQLAALSVLVHYAPPEHKQAALEQFYTQWQHKPLVIDRWFSLQACAPDTDTEKVRGLMLHPAFTLRNPNRARSLIFQFCINNLGAVHTQAGYSFWAEQVLALDKLNPEIAARLARVFDNWARFELPIQSELKAALEHIAAQTQLSANVREIILKALTL